MGDPVVDLAQYGGPLVVLVYLVWQSHFGTIKKLDRRMCVLVTVTRALARQTKGVDVDEVDQALARNGLSPEDFLEEKSVVHHARDFKDKRGGR